MDVDDMAVDTAPPAAPSPAAGGGGPATAAAAVAPASPTPTGTTTGSPGSAGAAAVKLAEPRRRNRPALSCIQCRTRKIRCDRNEPCASCMKSKIVNCTYEEARRPKPRLWRLSPAPAVGHPELSPTAAASAAAAAAAAAAADDRLSTGSSSTFTFRDMAAVSTAPLQPTSNPSGSTSSAAPPPPSGRTPDSLSGASPRSLPPIQHVEFGSGVGAGALAERVRQLEQQLADALKRPDYGSPPLRGSLPALSPPDGGGGLGASRRVEGAGGLVGGDKLFPLIVDVAHRIESDEHSEIYFLLQRCRELSRIIQSASIPTAPASPLGKALPPQETALRLVDAYFRTFESVYRVLHRSTFWQNYRDYWHRPEASDPVFVVQLQLCMALGTCFQDDAAALRRSATQWIYEAQVWLVTASARSRLGFGALQAMCLLHLARETCGVGGDCAWISAGCLLRTAMQIGLHRDPDTQPGMSVFAAEMRRRLWATVLEIVLQSSLDSGAPPLLALSDFDTRPPSNYDDDQLAESAKLPSAPRPPNAFTQTTVQLALLRSFPVRLAIVQYVNHFSSPAAFEETLRWNNELTNACRALSATFQPFYDPAGILPRRLSLFQLRLAEHMVHRFFLALNHPWLWAAHHNPTYYFARKMCVETSLKLYRAIATGSPAGDSGTASPSDDFTRLATCGYGAFRAAPTLAVLTICLELLWQVQEDRSFRHGGVDHQHSHHHHHQQPQHHYQYTPDRTQPPPPPSLPPLPTLNPSPSGSGSPPTDHHHHPSTSYSTTTTTNPNPNTMNTSLGMGMGIGIAVGAAPRTDLLEAVRYALGWAARRVRTAGDAAHAKAYLLFAALLCQAQALQRGVSEVEVAGEVMGCVGEELRVVGGMLEGVWKEVGLQGGVGRGEGWGEGRAGSKANGGMDGGRGEGWGWGRGWEEGDAVPTRGFNSIFNIHDADFFIGT